MQNFYPLLHTSLNNSLMKINTTVIFFILTLLLICHISCSRTGGRGTTKSCQNQCKGNDDEDCISECKKQKKLFATLFPSIFVGVPGLVFCIIGCTLCWKVQPQCRCCNNFDKNPTFLWMKQKYNQCSQNRMSSEQFQDKFKVFQNLLHHSSRRTFSYSKKSQENLMPVHLIFRKESQFLYRIIMDGMDNIGSFQAQGYFLCGQEGVKVWFMKVYDDRSQAKQTDEYYDLIFISERAGLNEFSGRWFYKGFDNEGEVEHRGVWNLRLGQETNMNLEESLY